MQIPKQIQSVPFVQTIKRMAVVTLYTTIFVVMTVSGPIIGTGALVALNFSMVLYLRNRWVTRFFSTALTSLIIGVSIAALFPTTTPIVFPLTLFFCSVSIVFATGVYLYTNKKSASNSSLTRLSQV